VPIFETKTWAEGDRLVVALSGECDLTARQQLASALVQAVNASREVFVDLTELRFIDSSGIHELVRRIMAPARMTQILSQIQLKACLDDGGPQPVR
jgi:anti-anti-sigma factor